MAWTAAIAGKLRRRSGRRLRLLSGSLNGDNVPPLNAKCYSMALIPNRKYYWLRLPLLGEIGRKSILPDGQSRKVEQLHCVLDVVPKSRIFEIHRVIVKRAFVEQLKK